LDYIWEIPQEGRIAAPDHQRDTDRNIIGMEDMPNLSQLYNYLIIMVKIRMHFDGLYIVVKASGVVFRFEFLHC